MAELPHINTTPKTCPRLESVDMLRGIVMVLMALDHVRDYFSNVRFDPLDLSQTDPVLFFTRWVTHFCAPVFVFLAGTGAFLSFSKGKSKSDLAKFLITRGIWLIVLEVTILRFAWLFNFDYTLILLQVIWAIGWSMIFLAALIFLPLKVIAVTGIAIICLHNTLDGITPAQLGIFGVLWMFLHSGGTFTFDGFQVIFGYPVLPWFGIIAAGYAFGSLLQTDAKKRHTLLIILGVSFIVLFFILRGFNLYGNPREWIEQYGVFKNFLAVINVEKYPPSLQYVLITLGPSFLLLAYLDNLKGFFRKVFLTFGRVPLFYYVLHIYAAHLLAVITSWVLGISPWFLFSNTPPWFWPGKWGFDVGFIYLFWIAVVVSLYPACVWYSRLKQKRKDWWLSYL